MSRSPYRTSGGGDGGVDTTAIHQTGAETATGPKTFSPGATTNQAVIVKGLASQTANLWETQDSNAAVFAHVTSAGKLVGRGSNTTTARIQEWQLSDGTYCGHVQGNPQGAAGLYFKSTAHSIYECPAGFTNFLFGGTYMQGNHTGVTTLRIAPVASGTVDIMTVYASNQSTKLLRVDKNGHLFTLKTAAPADGDINASEMAFWFDATNGAAKAKFKGKSADGTVVQGEVALS